LFSRKLTFMPSNAEGTRPDTSDEQHELESLDNLGGLGACPSTSAAVAG
jgi:hypothetical protein